jgi:transposase
MAMGAVKGQESTLQVAMVCLDELVPEDCRYRKLDRLVDWSFVREAAAPYYAEEVGRPSIDPVVLVKLVVALEGIGSARELCRVASLRLDLRRFLGYGFHERLPAHQTLSYARTRRFVDGELFERLFLRSVALCREYGLIEGTHLSVDGFHAEANAALASLRASLATAAGEEPDAHDSAADEGESEPPPPQLSLAPPQLSLAEPRSGPTPKRRSSNQTSVSCTDPDAKLRGKPGQRPHLVFRGQVGVDRQARCVVSCLGEEADGYEGDGLDPILDRARFACPELASVGADSGFAAERVWRGVERRGLVAYIPPQPTMLPKAGGEATSEAQRQALAARARCKSERGILAHKRRMADAEGVIGELKNQHGLDRARCRGTPLFHVQLLLACTALNCKRLADHLPRGRERRRGHAAGGRRRPSARSRERPQSRSRRIWRPRPRGRRAVRRLVAHLELRRLPQLTSGRLSEAVLGRAPKPAGRPRCARRPSFSPNS